MAKRSRKPRRNRKAARHPTLPNARFDVFNGTTVAELDAMAQELGEGQDFLLFDTPGRDDDFARHAATTADTLVTPLNDSFVDFDLIGQVDAETFKVRRLSFYAELIWEARKKRAMATIPRSAPRDGLGGGAQPHPARRGAQHAPPRRRADDCPSASAFASPTACPSASSIANCSRRG